MLLLSILTLGLFGSVWMFVQSNWTKKVTGQSKAFAWCLAYMLFIPVVFVVAFLAGALLVVMHVDPRGPIASLMGLVARLGGFVLYIGAAYSLKGELEARPFDIPLGGVMTFLFAPIYFQYHLHDFQFPDAGAGYGVGLAPLNDQAQGVPLDGYPAQTQFPPAV